MRAAKRLPLVALLLLAGCSGPEQSTSEEGVVTEAAASTAVGVPKTEGAGSVAGTLPAAARPTRRPVQAGGELAGKALPTNQWWSSALTGPLTQPLWAHPLALRVAGDGIQLSSAPPTPTAKSIVTPFIPAITAGGPVASVKVVGYGAFHVVLRAELDGGGAVEATLVQGSPAVYLTGAPGITFSGEAELDGTRARLTIAGQRWDAVAESPWKREGNRLSAGGGIAVARVPDGVDETQWREAFTADPVVSTTARMAYDNGVVTQTLIAEHRSGKPGVWALLPHQSPDGMEQLTGGYPDALGTLKLVRAKEVRVRVPMPGLVPTVPKVPIGDTTAVKADLTKDLADKPGAGGSYFGPKELGRLATIAEVAAAIGAEGQRGAALDRLRPQLVDWLTYGGPSDGHYFGYDEGWGGLVAVPAEFGANDYNDHHFQYGYLVRAAAVLGAADPGFARDYGSIVDLVVRDFTGGQPGFPPFRVFNAYLGHSAASGFAPFADGNNQESSSEAVAAWEAVTRWGLVRQNPELVEYGVTHYALEAATARRYWLGEGVQPPAGYPHTGAGIVWDAKVDYATWFDAKPESIRGIQLLPLTFGSLYRSDPAAAAARAAELERDIGGPPRAWGDLFAADLALADPAAAAKRLGPALPREESTGRALVRYWVAVLARLGPPQPGTVADSPYGLAFGAADHPTLVVANPTGADRTVTFRTGGSVTGTVTVHGGQTVIRR